VGAKDAYCRAQTEEGGESVVSDWLRHHSKDFVLREYGSLCAYGKKCVTLMRDYGEN